MHDYSATVFKISNFRIQINFFFQEKFKNFYTSSQKRLNFDQGRKFQGLKPVITKTAITAGTYQIFGNFNHNRNQNFYPQLTVTITINSLQKRVTINHAKKVFSK